jgi:hypothetical protein
MGKAKKAICPAEAGLRAMLKGDFSKFSDIPEDAKHRLLALSGDLCPQGDKQTEPDSPEQLNQLSSLVDMLGTNAACTMKLYRDSLNALRKGIKREIDRLKN